MKRYRLKVDLFDHKAGEEFKTEDVGVILFKNKTLISVKGHPEIRSVYNSIYAPSYPQYFEEISE